MSKKKEYEIGFSLGGKLQNSFTKAFSDTQKEMKKIQKSTEQTGKVSNQMSRMMQKSSQTTTASLNQSSRAAQELARSITNTGNRTTETMSRMARRTDGFANTFKNASNNALSSLGTMAARTQATANQMIQSFNSITPAFNRVATGISSSVTSTMILPFKSAIGMVQQYAGALGLLSGGALASSGMARLSAIENAEVSLRVMMGDADKAGAFLDDVLAFAKTTPFAFPDLAETARNLTAFGMETDKVVPTMKAIGDAAAASGKGSEGLRQIASAFGAMQVSGTLSLGEVNRLMDAGIPALKILANQTGKSVEQIKKDISAGMYDSVSGIDMLVDGMQYGTDGIAGATAAMDGIMEEMKQTWTGSVDSLKSSISSTMATLLEPIKPSIQDAMAWFGSTFSKLPSLFSTINTVTKPFQDNLKRLFNDVVPHIQGFGKAAQGVFALFRGNLSQGESLLEGIIPSENIGLITNTINKIKETFFDLVDSGKQIVSNVKSTFLSMLPTFKVVSEGIGNIVSVLLPYVGPAIKGIGSLIKNVTGQIATFWEKNGSQITQSLQNIYGFLHKTFIVLMPVISGIVKMVWNNVQGVFNGGIRAITGIIKTFSSLFTGDFRGMWEGVKDIFFGGVEFVWNLIQLTFYGRIIGGVKRLALGARALISGMWTGIRTFFTNGVTNAVQGVGRFVSGIRSGFTRARETAANLAKGMWEAVKKRFDDMVTGARALPKRIGDGIKAMASKAVDGVKKLGNDLIGGLSTVINGVVGGINWVIGKIGVGTTIPAWTPPAYAKGTDSHPGGLAIVGDGGGPELIRTPDGKTSLSPGRDTLINLPKGTQVLPHRQTKELMQMGMPGYAEGTGMITNAWEGVKNFAGNVKNVTLDIFDYIGNPEKLLDNLLNQIGVSLPSINGAFGEILSGSFSVIKDKAVSWIKDKLGDFGGSMNTFGNLRVTSPFGWRTHPIFGGRRFHAGMDFGGPMGYPIRANVGGTVNGAGWRGGYGNTVTVQQGMYTHLYAHLSRIIARLGQIVKPGDPLGLLGSTGNSTGPHLHYEVRKNGVPINPAPFAKGFAKGGKVPNTQWAWVGEQGPELAHLPGGSRVFNHEDSLDLARGGQGQSVQFIFSPNITIEGSANESDILKSLEVAYEEFKRFMQRYENEKRRLSF